MSRTRPAIINLLPTPADRVAANRLRHLLSGEALGGPVRLRLADGTGGEAEVALPGGVAGAIIGVLRQIAISESLSLVPIGQMLTTQQAADILGVPRRHVVELLHTGTLPHIQVGGRYRISAPDLADYGARQLGRAAMPA